MDRRSSLVIWQWCRASYFCVKFWLYSLLLVIWGDRLGIFYQKVELTKSAVAYCNVENRFLLHSNGMQQSKKNMTHILSTIVPICQVTSKKVYRKIAVNVGNVHLGLTAGLHFCLMPDSWIMRHKTQPVPNDPDIWAV